MYIPVTMQVRQHEAQHCNLDCNLLFSTQNLPQVFFLGLLLLSLSEALALPFLAKLWRGALYEAGDLWQH